MRMGASEAGSKLWDWSMRSLEVALYRRVSARSAVACKALFFSQIRIIVITNYLEAQDVNLRRKSMFYTVRTSSLRLAYGKVHLERQPPPFTYLLLYTAFSHSDSHSQGNENRQFFQLRSWCSIKMCLCSPCYNLKICVPCVAKYHVPWVTPR